MVTSAWETGNYRELAAHWPTEGRHILAQFDGESVIVYQAYRASIAQAALASNRLGGGGFSFDRMSWIKPNFLWMTYRSGWGTKPDQEVTLALRIRRDFFDGLLSCCVASTFQPDIHGTKSAWMDEVRRSEVRIQWDPDHDPAGGRLARRALQLGLRGEPLRRLAGAAMISISDVSEFVSKQRAVAVSGDWDELRVADEAVYPVEPERVRRRLGLSPWP